MNPLFADNDSDEKDKRSYLLSNSKGKRLEPLSEQSKSRHSTASPAVDLIRQKIDSMYTSEPDAQAELAQHPQAGKPLSKHQEFMHSLSISGKSLAHIQTAWHEYYVNLPDQEKHEVWQEFYRENNRATSHYAKFVAASNHHAKSLPAPLPPHGEQASAKATRFAETHDSDAPPLVRRGTSRNTTIKRSVADIKKQITARVKTRSDAQLKAKKHLQSLMFGLGMGSLVIIVFLFSFFNERFITPFIQPSGRVGATPIILNTNGVAPSPNPELIIPKINVQLPVVYNLPSIDEPTVQRGLEDGVIHYPNTSLPGQRGNAAFFGHSSNNIFNKGAYKFAFVLLHELAPGDIFYLTRDGKVYSYRVFDKKVVEPNETWVLGPVNGKVATAALITCDPPGTSLHRLVVWGEQISPDPLGNTSAPAAESTPTEPLPSEGPTLWSRFWRWITPW